MQIALALYPGFTVLDIIGPLQVLADVPGHDIVFVAGDAGRVTDHTGRCQLVASATFAEVTAPDVVVVPGELFAERDDRLVRWLRQVHPTTTWTTSVSTGSIYLAAARVPRWRRCNHALDADRRARTAWRSLHRAACGRARQGDHRGGGFEWHRHGTHPARSDVRSGRCPDRAAGHRIRPQPPFDAGSPSKARQRSSSSRRPHSRRRGEAASQRLRRSRGPQRRSGPLTPGAPGTRPRCTGASRPSRRPPRGRRGGRCRSCRHRTWR